MNVLLNGAIAWLLFRGMATVPLWGQESIAGARSPPHSCFLSTLIATAVVRAQVRSGYVSGLALPAASPLRRLPRARAGRGAVLGLGASCWSGCRRRSCSRPPASPRWRSVSATQLATPAMAPTSRTVRP